MSFLRQILLRYPDFKVEGIDNLQIKHNELKAVIQKVSRALSLEADSLGNSNENREIFRLKFGRGSKVLYIFSQMHGNESTGTRVIADALNFLTQKACFRSEIELIARECTLVLVPMINPDGAEKFSRYNAFDTDINRDAQALQTIEGQLLMKDLDAAAPDFVYSLHDQPAHYAVHGSLKPAAFSFLAPAFNASKDINPVRLAAIQRVTAMAEAAEQFYPEAVAKYSDDYMPSAFGDKIQKKGFSSILVETGHYYYYGDRQKNTLRKHHFAFLLNEILMQARENVPDSAQEKYEALPYMKKDYYFDVLIRNLNLIRDTKTQQADIGIERIFTPEGEKYAVKQIGDLSMRAAYKEADAAGQSIKIPVARDADATGILQMFPSIIRLCP